MNKHKELPPSSKRPWNPYLFVSISAVTALIIVLFILGSNKSPQAPPGTSEPEPQMNEAITARVQELQNALRDNPNDPSLNVEMANLLFDIRDYTMAISYYRRSLQVDSLNLAAQIDLAICYFNLQQVDSAIHEMKKALKIDPFHVKGLFNIGVMYYNTGSLDEAKFYWNKLTEMHPEAAEAIRARDLLNKLED